MKTVEEYMALPYTLQLKREDETTWFASVKELRGCMTEADNALEALAVIFDAMREWLEAAIEIGYPIPEPEELE